MAAGEADLRVFLAKVGTGPRGAQSLTFEEAREAMLAILAGRWHPVTLGGFLMAMRWKGETAEELAGFAAAVRETLAWDAGGGGAPWEERTDSQAAGVLDCAGNYDGKERTLHLGVAAGLVAAAAGQPVVLHGAEGVPTKEGVTPVAVARALGLPLPATGEEAAELVRRYGFAVLDQRAFHPRLAALLPERRTLCKRSFLNSVETLANPLGAAAHLGSFAHAPFAERLCRAAGRGAGFRRVAAVMGLEGMDELRPGRTRVAEWRAEEPEALRRLEVDPRELGCPFTEEDLAAEGDLAERVRRSAAVTESVLAEGKPDGAREAVVANAALRLYAGGRASSLEEGVVLARAALADGHAARLLEALRAEARARGRRDEGAAPGFPEAGARPPEGGLASPQAWARAAELDRRFIWHPFTPMRLWLAEEPLVVVEGAGVRVRDAAGRWYYDGNSSLWVNVHGHRRPEIDAAVRAQLGLIAHSTALGLASVPASLLAERLVALAPAGLARVFYSDNGSTAVEIALKMAFQYWRHRGRPEKRLFLKLQNAYHGDTVGAVSVGGIDLFHSAFAPLLFETVAAPSPYCYRCPLGFPYEASPAAAGPGGESGAARSPGEGAGCGLACAAEFERLVAEHADRLAAAIVEPLVQAAAGIITMPPGFLRSAREACRRHGVLFIADEVATGFGRTGRLFACEHEGVAPDLMCVAKGLTGGYLPLAATLVSEEVFSAFLGEEGEFRTFYHGHSYTGNQLGCAAALASLDLFARDRVLEGLPRKAELVARRLAELADAPGVGEVRQRGLMVGIEVVRDRATKEPFPPGWRVGQRVCRRCRELGMITRPLGDVVVFMPPLASTEAELAEMLSLLVRALRETLAELGAR